MRVPTAPGQLRSRSANYQPVGGLAAQQRPIETQPRDSYEHQVQRLSAGMSGSGGPGHMSQRVLNV